MFTLNAALFTDLVFIIRFNLAVLVVFPLTGVLSEYSAVVFITLG